MLEIINKLKVFFEDCYKETNVREYSRLMKISPPSASKILKQFEKEGLLVSRIERRNYLFRVNRNSTTMRDLSRIYWKERFEKMLEFLKIETNYLGVVLFGSLSKLEVNENSDIDLMIFSNSERIDLRKFEKLFGREIQCFFESSIEKIPLELKLNIMRGCILDGTIV